MVNHLVDVEPIPATCNRCGSFVLAALSGGRYVAADAVRMDFATMVLVLRTGRQVFRLRTLADTRPRGLDRVTRTLLEYDGAKSWSYVAAHGCGCHPQDVTALTVEKPKPVAPCEAWMFAGWAQPLECPRNESPELLGCGLCAPAPF